VSGRAEVVAEDQARFEPVECPARSHRVDGVLEGVEVDIDAGL
jgi:hypothetical protein